jgi:transcriptional regulator with XRE-family HTH domain
MSERCFLKSCDNLPEKDFFFREIVEMTEKQALKNGETFGQRLARLRKKRGVTQVELAMRVGLAQSNVSDYEHDVFRPNADMLLRIAQELRISTDELLGLRSSRPDSPILSRKIIKRMTLIEKLPLRHQRALLQTIDIYLKGAQA